MLNQVAVEALYSATYVETYLDSVENLPDDVQRYLSRIREIDVQYRAYLRDVDVQYDQWSNYMNCSDNDPVGMSKKTRAMSRIQQSLIAAQELGDEKLQIVTQLQELIDHKTRQLDHDFKNLDYGKDEPMLEIKDNRAASPPLQSPIVPINGVQQAATIVTSPGIVLPPVGLSTTTVERIVATNTTTSNNTSTERTTTKRARRTRTETISGNTSGTNAGLDVGLSDSNTNNDAIPAKPLSSQVNASSVQKKVSSTSGSGKKKKRKTRGGVQQNSSNQNSRETRDDTPPLEEPIDPDEPTYCLCDQISFGEMILCDNDLCPIEWFHFSCVSLMSKPKGKWFCPNCRGDRPNVMKPKAQFLKELERYNKEKEEKT